MNLSILLGVIGWPQIIIIILAIIILFGGKKIPELMRGIGQGMKEFKKATKPEDEKEKKTEDAEK